MRDRYDIEDIRSRHDLRTEWPYYSGRQRLISGKYFQDLCPYHNDSHPSFLVYDTHAFCLSCGARVDIFSLVMEQQNISFYQALQLLSDGQFVPEHRHIDRVRVQLAQADEAEPPEPLDESELKRFRLAEKKDIAAISDRWDMDIVRSFGLRVDYRGLIVFPVYEHGRLANIKLYNPGSRVPGMPKWRPLDAGRGSQLYGADAITESDTAVIVESEKDVVAGAHLGVNGMAFVATGGSNKFSTSQRARLVNAGMVFVLGDNDAAGSRFNIKVTNRISSARSLWWCYIISGWRPGVGYDVAEFVHESYADADLFTEFIEANRDAGFFPPVIGPIYSIDDL